MAPEDVDGFPLGVAAKVDQDVTRLREQVAFLTAIGVPPGQARQFLLPTVQDLSEDVETLKRAVSNS